eukprot:2342092-Amphidinium_carterae.1
MPIPRQICMGILQPILSQSHPKNKEPAAEPKKPVDTTRFIESENFTGGEPVNPPFSPLKAWGDMYLLLKSSYMSSVSNPAAHSCSRMSPGPPS